MRNTLILAAIIMIAFGCGFLSGKSRKMAPPSFHDMIVNNPHELLGLVTPKDRRVKDLADELGTHEKAYFFVRDRIVNDPAMPALPAGEMLAAGRASCLGKAILLCSIYRALGDSPSEVRVVTGEVDYPGGVVDHAWLDLEYKGMDIQQDATNLVGHFGFDQFRGMAYTNIYIRREGYTFNDKSFAIVSRLNQMKGTGHPMMRLP